MIKSFGDKATEALFHGLPRSRLKFPTDLVDKMLVKLDLVNAAKDLNDLRAPPGNHLELLRGDWAGFHSIRVNKQWRVVFKWQSDGAHDVMIKDYH